MRKAERPVIGLERTLAPYYPGFVVFGVLCFAANIILNHEEARLIAVVWVVLIPLWIRRYRVYRASRKQP